MHPVTQMEIWLAMYRLRFLPLLSLVAASACGGTVLSSSSTDSGQDATPAVDGGLDAWADAAEDVANPQPDAGPDTAVQPSIGSAVPGFTRLVIEVNLSDGFMAPYASDGYTVDFSSGIVSFNEEQAVNASPAELAKLDALLRSTPYRYIDSCVELAVDGAPYPPTITLSDSSSSKEFGASDQDCAHSDHDVWGDVIGCADFQAIHAAVLAMLGMQEAPAACLSYAW